MGFEHFHEIVSSQRTVLLRRTHDAHTHSEEPQCQAVAEAQRCGMRGRRGGGQRARRAPRTRLPAPCQTWLDDLGGALQLSIAM